MANITGITINGTSYGLTSSALNIGGKLVNNLVSGQSTDKSIFEECCTRDNENIEVFRSWLKQINNEGEE